MSNKIDYANGINVDLNTVYLNGVKFTGISIESKLGWEELVFEEEPTRSKGTFALENIDDIDAGLVSRCIIKFPYLNIKDYINLVNILKQRTFYVKFFNTDIGEWIIREMYCSNRERDKLYTFRKELLGSFGFTIELVGTNRDLWKDDNGNDIYGKDLEIKYHSNGGNGNVESDYVTWSEVIKLDNGLNFTKSGYHIKEWNTKEDGTGWSYGLNQKVTIWQSLNLYAIWEKA